MQDKAIVDTQKQKHFSSGDIIMRQGDEAGPAYVIESGRVEIILEQKDGKTQSLGTRGAGTIVGEMSIVDSAHRSATVVALEDCQMLEITRDDFLMRLEKADTILQMITRVILTRYRDMLTRADIRGERHNWPPAEIMELDYADKTHAVQKIKIASDFERGLEKGEVFLHYQPIIGLDDDKVRGFEALMRWEHPEHGFISPGVFIPIAEENGLITKASQWALRESCEALKRMENKVGSEKELFMSVNFSSTDFSSDDFVESIYETISKTDLQPSQLHVEITERLLMHQPENARETLEMCRKAGMAIAIDDFGTGYSSLSYLHYFPINSLKIDRSFIQDMHKNKSSVALVGSIIAMAKNLEMEVIAEGAELEEEVKILKELGCDMVQGYYFAKPMLEQDVIKYLKP